MNRSCDAGSLNETLARGKVVLCFQSRSQKTAANAARTILEMQGVGVIYAQYPAKDVTLAHGIPLVQVDFIVGTYLLNYMEATRYYSWISISNEIVISLNHLPSIFYGHVSFISFLGFACVTALLDSNCFHI